MIRKIKQFVFLLAALPLTSTAQDSLTGHEYWIDNNYASRTFVSTDAADVSLEMDLNEMTPGVHFFNFRAQNDSLWGSLLRYVFYVPFITDKNVSTTGYEYWLDNNYNARTFKAGSVGDVSLALSAESLGTGMHYFNFRAQNSQGVWGSLLRYMFYVPAFQNDAAAYTGYTYWLDDDYKNATTVKTTATDIALNIPIDDMPVGIHLFNIRPTASDGSYGPLLHYIFTNIPNEDPAESNLVGYKVQLGNRVQYVAIEPTKEVTFDNLQFDIPWNETPNGFGKGTPYEFDGNVVKLSLTSNVDFSMQFENNIGRWSNRITYSEALSRNIEHTVTTFPLDKDVDVDGVGKNDFAPYSLNITKKGDYVLTSSEDCTISLYKATSGNAFVQSIELVAGKNQIASINAGNYVAIIHDQHGEEQMIMSITEDNGSQTPGGDAGIIAGADATLYLGLPEPQAVVTSDFNQLLNQVKLFLTTDNAMLFANENIMSLITTSGKTNNVAHQLYNGTWEASEVRIVDSAPFHSPVDVETKNVTYTRTFTDICWQPLYVPFAMKYEAWANKAEIAYINNVHQWDDDNDGVYDRTTLEFLTLKKGSTEPNIPYVIKPKQTGEMTFSVEDATLMATPQTDGYVDCMSTRERYILNGTYQTKTDMYDNGYYALENNVFLLAENASATLSPFRLYLNIENRRGEGTVRKARKINIMVDGIENPTGVDSMLDDMPNTSNDVIYNLSGQRVGKPSKTGMYIVNGKKILIK